MNFLFVYRGGVVPDDQVERNINELWRWLDNLKERGYEKVRFAGYGRKTVSQHSMTDYQGDIFGVSIVEAKSLEEAASLTSDWPELPYGGTIEIFEALAADYPDAGSDAYILKLFADIRTQLLSVIRELPKNLLDLIPQGFSNHLHWQAGHVLAITDELVFTGSGAGSRIPQEYKTFFARGTSPADWIGSPPDMDEILKCLEDQMKEISGTFSGKLTQPVADPGNFLQASVIGDLFQVLIAHESTHLGMIQAMAKVLQ